MLQRVLSFALGRGRNLSAFGQESCVVYLMLIGYGHRASSTTVVDDLAFGGRDVERGGVVSARRGFSLLPVVGLLLVASALVTGHRAGGLAAGSGGAAVGAFAGTASADGVHVNLSIPDYLIVQNFVDAPGPTAQAALDSLNTSKALASFPYPGDTEVSLTGLVGILTGLSLPSYPLLASTSNPTKIDDRIDQPGFHLVTHSDDTSSSSLAQLGEATASGAADVGAVSSASVTAAGDGTVTAQASTRLGVSLGPVALDGFSAQAKVAKAPDGNVTKSSDMVVGGITIAGVRIGITDRGLVVAGVPVPLDGLKTLVNTLTQGKATVEFVPKSETATSIVSAGLRVTTTQMVDAIHHPVVVTATIGQVAAAADSTPLPTDSTPDALSSGGSAATGPVSAPSLDGALGGTGAAAPGLASGGSSASSPSPAVRRAAQRSALEGIPTSLSSWSFFPILVAAAAVVVLGALASRRRAGKPWNS